MDRDIVNRGKILRANIINMAALCFLECLVGELRAAYGSVTPPDFDSETSEAPAPALPIPTHPTPTPKRGIIKGMTREQSISYTRDQVAKEISSLLKGGRELSVNKIRGLLGKQGIGRGVGTLQQVLESNSVFAFKVVEDPATKRMFKRWRLK